MDFLENAAENGGGGGGGVGSEGRVPRRTSSVDFGSSAEDGPLNATESGQVGGAVKRAVECCLALQSAFGEYEVEQHTLHIHVGIGAGRVAGFNVGGFYGKWEFAFFGAPFEQLATTLDLAQKGEIALSPEAWVALDAHARAMREAITAKVQELDALAAAKKETYITAILMSALGLSRAAAEAKAAEAFSKEPGKLVPAEKGYVVPFNAARAEEARGEALCGAEQGGTGGTGGAGGAGTAATAASAATNESDESPPRGARISVLSASDLRNADGMLGKSDPFVELTWRGASVLKTKVREREERARCTSMCV